FAVFAVTDALFAPLAERQVVRAREAALQTARNDSLLAVAEAYFNVQQARGELAGAIDAARRTEEVVRRTEKLAAGGEGILADVDVVRARTEFARRDQALDTARERWRVASADLIRDLRLECGAAIRIGRHRGTGDELRLAHTRASDRQQYKPGKQPCVRQKGPAAARGDSLPTRPPVRAVPGLSNHRGKRGPGPRRAEWSDCKRCWPVARPRNSVQPIHDTALLARPQERRRLPGSARDPAVQDEFNQPDRTDPNQGDGQRGHPGAGRGPGSRGHHARSG